MNILTPRNLHRGFEIGQAVRVKRHGYQRHYEGRLAALECPPEGEDVARVVLDGGYCMAFTIGGDYAVCASADTPWDLIPHPQSAEWDRILEAVQAETDAEIAGMENVAPAKWEDIPLRLKLALGLSEHRQS